jgi:septum formation protein
MRLVLASASPRRADLLRAAAIPFDVHPVDVDERFRAGERPEDAVARVAEMKAAAALALHPDAARMLRLLSGRSHDVFTGICLSCKDHRLVHVEPTRVRMARLSDAEIDWYVSTREPFDKAGGYAVQGFASRFIEGIEGSYSNVVGLPISSVYALLKELGCDILGVKKSQ